MYIYIYIHTHVQPGTWCRRPSACRRRRSPVVAAAVHVYNTCMHIPVYIYIYIYRERETEIDIHTYVCMYIYIYICAYTHIVIITIITCNKITKCINSIIVVPSTMIAFFKYSMSITNRNNNNMSFDQIYINNNNNNNNHDDNNKNTNKCNVQTICLTTSSSNTYIDCQAQALGRVPITPSTEQVLCRLVCSCISMCVSISIAIIIVYNMCIIMFSSSRMLLSLLSWLSVLSSLSLL